MKKFLILLICLAALLSVFSPTRPTSSQPQLPDKAQITAFLEEHPLVGGAGAGILEVRIQRGSLVIDLSEAVLPEGVYDEPLFTQLQADLDRSFDINLLFMTTFLVEGKPLEFWGHPLPDFSIQTEPPEIRELPGDGPLAGVKIALSPGHGLYWNETYSAWFWQRASFWGIREDTLNPEIMRYVQTLLHNQGATVIQLRELDFNARIGVSGAPAWHEAARQYAIAEGLPSWIWDGSNNNYNSDIRTRPYMANYYGADIFISLHNNGWDGKLRGTETYWDVNNHPGSQALANAVHNRVIQTIRAEVDPNWTNRGVKSSDWNYGEIYFAQMPAILLELAFMDNELDNNHLKQESFKILAAKAITKGVCDYWGVTCDNVSLTLPLTMETPALSPAYGSGMCDSGWFRYPNERGQYAFLTLNTIEDKLSTHQASWLPNLPASGEYRVEAFIPGHGPIDWNCPQKTIQEDTGHANYMITHANGITTLPISQRAYENRWADLGIFHFNNGTQASVTLRNNTWESHQTTTVSASAMRFTLVGNQGLLFHDTAWVADLWIRAKANTPADYIRNFFILKNSCLAEPILDSDGEEIDIPTQIQQAASTNQVNPGALLAIMEAEQGAITHCPDSAALESLMGLQPATTARQQISAAAAGLKNAINALETTNSTPNGWVTGNPKTTLDGVTVTPANDTITVLFDFYQYAGAIWSGNEPNESGVQGIYQAYRDYGLGNALPIGIFIFYFPLLSR